MVINSEGSEGNLSLLLFMLVAPVTEDDGIIEQYPKNWHCHDKHVFVVVATMLQY